MIDKLKEMVVKSKHFQMEIFCVSFIILVALLGICAVVAYGMHYEKSIEKLGNQAIYTKSFTTSKTNVTGNVTNVYCSEDKTKSFLLFKFTEVNNISTNANNYQIFITASDANQNKQNVKGRPYGSYYVFGNSGYMGVYLVNNEGFDTQILNLVIRANTEIVAGKDKVDDKYVNTDFEVYDQFRIYYNPGASEAETISCLNSDSIPTVNDLFLDTVVAKEEAEIRGALDSKMKDMQTDLNSITEYENRLANSDGVRVPARPNIIAGDTMVVDNNGDLEYRPNYVFAGGYNYDWRHGSIREGYLDKLIAQTGQQMTNEQFFAYKTKEMKNAADTINETLSSNSIKWYLSDGTPLEDLKSSTSGSSTKVGGDRYTTINNDCQQLISAWTKYRSDKVDYQVNLLGKLLLYESQADLIGSTATVNSDSECFVVY